MIQRMEEVLLSYSYILQTDYVLLEMEKKMLERIRSKKSAPFHPKATGRPGCRDEVKLILKGYRNLYAHDTSESAVVRRIEYSNTLLLASHLKCRSHSKAILSSSNTMYQIQSVQPGQNVLHLLRLSYLTSDELNNRKINRDSVYSFKQLAFLSNSTPRQLAETLVCKGALIHQGSVRLLDPLLVFSTLRSLIQHPKSLSLKLAFLQDYPHAPSVICKTIEKLYCTPDEGIIISDNKEIKDLNPRKVMVALAGFIFLSHDKPIIDECHSVKGIGMNINAFVELWKKEIQVYYNEMKDKLPLKEDSRENDALVSILNGNVVVNEKESIIWWIPADHLPYDIELRLKILFYFNPNKWSSQCLQAYIEQLLKPEQSFAHAIQRFTREYRVPGCPLMYSQLTS